MTRIYDNIPVPVKNPTGRPASATDFGVLGPSQCLFVTIPEDAEAAKVLNKVKGQVARWRKASTGRADFKFTVAISALPDDPMGTQAVGVWRTA